MSLKWYDNILCSEGDRAQTGGSFDLHIYVTQRQLMRLFAVKLILSYEQFSKIKVYLKRNFDINSMNLWTQN